MAKVERCTRAQSLEHGVELCLRQDYRRQGNVLGRSERAPKRVDIPSEKDECLWSGSNYSRDVAHHVAKDVENIKAPNLKIVVGLEITDLELCSRTRST